MDPDATKSLANRCFRYALSLTHDRQAAEDLVQEAWSATLSAGGRLDKPYLFRAIRSRWIDAHRRRQVVQFEAIEAPIRDERADPREIDRDALDRALATLRAEEREVLFLQVVEGYSTAEVGELVGRPKNTVLTQLHRGRARLRAWFEERAQEAL